MNCPQCGMPMTPMTIPFRWQCGNHQNVLYAMEPEPLCVEDLGIADYTVAEARRQTRWDERVQQPRFQYGRPYMDRGVPPPPMAERFHLQIANDFIATTYKPPTPIEKEKILVTRKMTAKWFDEMPKSLKLVYIESNPECTRYMEQYAGWNEKSLRFEEMTSGTQALVTEAHKKFVGKQP